MKNDTNKPEYVTQKMETELENAIQDFYPDNAEDVYQTWDDCNEYILLAKYKSDDEKTTKYILIRGFFINDKPCVSVDFDGLTSDLINSLMFYKYNKKIM